MVYSSLEEGQKNKVEKGLKNLFRVDVFVPDEITPSHGHDKSLFAKSHRGMFLGFLLFGATIISIVLFFFVGQEKSFPGQDDLNFLLSELILETCLLAANIAAIVKLNPLSYVNKPTSVDDFLLLIAMFGTILFQMATVMASASAISLDQFIKSIEVLRLCSAMVGILQAIIQVSACTPHIIW